jgi:hypothetical protein
VAGAERVGISFKGDVCPGETISAGKNHSVKSNIVYSSLAGVTLFSGSFLPKTTCVRVSGFTVFKSSHWGLYLNTPLSLLIEANTLIENQVGVFPFVIFPKSTDHDASNKTIVVQNNVIVGRTPQFNCDRDVKPDDMNANLAELMYSYGAGADYKGFIGIVWSNFISDRNGAPINHW